MLWIYVCVPPYKKSSINGDFFMNFKILRHHSKGGSYRVSCENNAVSYKFLVFLMRP
jgi:hypothetical protein